MKTSGEALQSKRGVQAQRLDEPSLWNEVVWLLADTEAGENSTQQIVGTEGSGDFAEGLLSLA